MGMPIVIALAKEPDVAACGNWNGFPGGIPAAATSAIEIIVDEWFQSRTPTGVLEMTMEAALEELAQYPDKISSIAFIDANDDELSEIVDLSRFLASRLGAVTLIYDEFSRRIEIRPGTTRDNVMNLFLPKPSNPRVCPNCGRKSPPKNLKCMYCGGGLSS